MRRAIDTTLAAFVPAAVAREDPTRAWELAGPGLRAGGSLREWKAGKLPDPPVRLRGRQVAARLDDDLRAARPRRDRPDALPARTDRARGRSLSGSISCPASKAGWWTRSSRPRSGRDKGERAFVTGMQDFTGRFGSKESTYDKPDLPRARLSALWLLVPGLLLGACLVAPLVLAARSLANRRHRRPPEPLPPLPSTVSRERGLKPRGRACRFQAKMRSRAARTQTIWPCSSSSSSSRSRVSWTVSPRPRRGPARRARRSRRA